jgi:N-hydroxyarylamine O-acetyltransferase
MLQPYEYADYVDRCHFHQTSPESPFTKGQVCTLATLEGRITLRNMRLITTVGGDKQERLIADQEEHQSVLRELFGIELGSEKQA